MKQIGAGSAGADAAPRLTTVGSAGTVGWIAARTRAHWLLPPRLGRIESGIGKYRDEAGHRFHSTGKRSTRLSSLLTIALTTKTAMIRMF